MEQETVAARIFQINEQLALLEKKQEQYGKFLERVPPDDTSRANYEQAFKQNGKDEIIELLHEKASLSYVLDPIKSKGWKANDLTKLITPSIREEANAIIKNFELKHGKPSESSCSIARCVQCVMCPSTCAGACSTCVHCPPNGVIHT